MSESDVTNDANPVDTDENEEYAACLVLDEVPNSLFSQISQIMLAVRQSNQEAVSMAMIPPLELVATASFDPSLYGIVQQHQNGPLVNCWVKVRPGVVNDPTGTCPSQMHKARVGTVVAQNKDRVVVRMSNFFLGWIPPDRYAVANIVITDTPTTH